MLYPETLMQAKTEDVDGVATLLLTPRSDSALPARLDRSSDRLGTARHVSQVEAFRQLAHLSLTV